MGKCGVGRYRKTSVAEVAWVATEENRNIIRLPIGCSNSLHGASTQHGSMAESAEAVGMSRAGMQQLCARAKAHLGL
jgi:hypothetical protein